MSEFKYKSKYATYDRCIFQVGRYPNGNLAVEIWSQTEGPVNRVTVNPDVPLSDDMIAIKDYSENEGMVESMVELGIIIEPAFMTIQSGWVEIPVHMLTEKGKQMLGI